MSVQSYEKWLDFLFNLKRTRCLNPMENIAKVCEKLQNPHLAYKTIHITGTNGKGTVATQCASILHHSGYKTGLMTSPHLFDFCERFQINSEKVPKEYVAENTPVIKEIIEDEKLMMNYSLIAASLGFKYFRDCNTDFSVIEVGSGGTSDFTNIVDPEVSVITSVGLDHCEYFGNTIEDIAIEKSGVIKPGKPCVIGPNTPVDLLYRIAKEKKSELVVVDKRDNYESTIEENCRITNTIIQVLKNQGVSISDQAIQNELKSRPPFRMEEKEVLGRKIIFDVAHNQMAFERLFNDLQKMHRGKNIRVILAYGKSRDPRSILDVICKYAHQVHLVSNDDFLLYDSEILKSVAYSVNKNKISTSGDIDTVLGEALRDMAENEILLVCGSFYIMNSAKNALLSIKNKFPEL